MKKIIFSIALIAIGTFAQAKVEPLKEEKKELKTPKVAFKKWSFSVICANGYIVIGCACYDTEAATAAANAAVAQFCSLPPIEGSM